MKIKSFLLSLGCVLFLVSCNKENKTEKVDYVLFSGTVKNAVENEIKIYGDGNNFGQTIVIKEDGTFSDTLKIDTKGTYGFIIGQERSSIYLDFGNQLNLSIDVKEFDESIKYTGAGSDENNYLAEKLLLQESFLSEGPEGYKNLFSKDAKEFKNEALKQEQAKNELLKKFTNINPEFVSIQTSDNHYEYLSMINDFKGNHAYYTKKTGYKTPEGFLDELTSFDIDNSKDFESSQAYRRLVMSVFDRISSEKADADNIPFDKAQMESLSKIKSKNIRNILIKNIAYQVSPRNDNAVELYNMIMAASDDEEFKSELTQQFEKVKQLVKGNESPVFNNYENFAGGTTSLNDLKGKYVYIDVWATWCGPCKAEIPHLKKIEKEFHNKNIEFVSISIDKKAQHDAWKKMVTEKELGGIQLFADNNWSSQFIVDYGIQGIPRFILIDPNGKIVSASAPRPSDAKLLDVFKELKI
ncbi:TlpA family protein disulfide reductase [Aquimarina algiphila]|uniref:TlpA family protein disulfide reductase n=1 Tax=Aquimarina algiphila TaxID=2047982 RepID=UPI0024936C2D|nr:redoxin family protein [Aquimarina algiphila]